MLIRRNAQGVHGKKKVGSSWFRLKFNKLLKCRNLIRVFLKFGADEEGFLFNSSPEILYLRGASKDCFCVRK